MFSLKNRANYVNALLQPGFFASVIQRGQTTNSSRSVYAHVLWISIKLASSNLLASIFRSQCYAYIKNVWKLYVNPCMSTHQNFVTVIVMNIHLRWQSCVIATLAAIAQPHNPTIRSVFRFSVFHYKTPHVRKQNFTIVQILKQSYVQIHMYICIYRCAWDIYTYVCI